MSLYNLCVQLHYITYTSWFSAQDLVCVWNLVIGAIVPLEHGWGQRGGVVVHTHHGIRHNTPVHNILSTALQLSISQKALGTLPEDGNVMPKHVGATIHN
jgi:hypothetical protein